MSANPLVSIIIPTYNREDKLPEAINSAISQTYKNIQIIVIDDGSVDSTRELVATYPQIEYYWQKNQGQAAARNSGLKKTKGSIIASLDSDDIWFPDFLKLCVEKLENEQLDFVFANWEQEAKVGNNWSFLDNDPYLKPYFHKINGHWINLDNEELRELYVKACPSPSSSVVMRKSSIVSGWDEDIRIGDDWCLYLEMILSNSRCKAAFTLEKLWKKRIDEINIYDGRKWSEVLEFLYIADLKIKMEKFQHLLRKNELSLMQKRYMASLIELSKHKLVRDLNIPKSIGLLKKSFSISVPYTLRTIPDIFMTGIERKVRLLADKLKKKQ
ncbi:glycosyltransferase family 2 protein [Pedobacter sp.]|jgi:glycosyltransferase involved in cell wall biosynthesis|uniref:glycosyltransferase family 2 protein n=1 Tax=Pedobacter sp. TaxID=1411316 RepID=UPI002CF448CB|nr:glycosyltransferase family 2 protein [Pedobacter sp.]HWW42406.1 glycosyltransferase family 2 protein [Pedobacter sp.]